MKCNPDCAQLAFTTLAMTLHDKIEKEHIGHTHQWQLAWSGVIGCLVPILLGLVSLPTVPRSLAHTAVRKRIAQMNEACMVHQVYTSVT